MVELIPRQVLFGNPERISPRISPDGTQLAWIAPSDGVLNVWVAPAGTGQGEGIDWSAARVVTDDSDRGIRMFAWAHDGRHLLYLQDTGGDENWRLHDVDLATMQRRDLTPFDNVQTQLIAGEKKFPTEILVGLNRDNPQLHDVYRLDLTTGELTKEVENPGFVGWVADSQLVVRAGVAPQPDGGLVLMVRGGDGDEWRSLLSIDAEDALTSGPVAFSEDGTAMLVMSSVGTNTGRLVRLNLATGDAEVLAEDPEADVTGIRLHPDTREPQIVTFLKDRSEYRVLDPDVAVPVRDPSRARPLRAGPDGAFLLHRQGRPHHPRLCQLPARRRPGRAADGAQRARRPLGARRLGLRSRGAVAGQPRLPVHPGELSRLDRVRQGVRQRRRPGVGRPDARRPGGRDRAYHRPGLGRSRPDSDLLRLLRRLCRPGRGGVHPGTVPLRRRYRRPLQPEDPDRDGPAVLGSDDLPVPPAAWRPGEGRRLPLVPVTAVACGQHQHSAAHRPGSQRPPGEAGRVGTDRRRAQGGRDRPRVHALPRRGPRLRQAGEPAAFLCRGRAVPGQAPRRACRGVKTTGRAISPSPRRPGGWPRATPRSGRRHR